MFCLCFVVVVDFVAYAYFLTFFVHRHGTGTTHVPSRLYEKSEPEPHCDCLFLVRVCLCFVCECVCLFCSLFYVFVCLFSFFVLFGVRRFVRLRSVIVYVWPVCVYVL